jgi:TonB-dependent starch-binding outer membrane protein SusC
MEKKRMLKVVALMLPLMLFSFWSIAQALMVQGTVTDEKKAPMPGVTVAVKGTTVGTITDVNGSYSISVPAGSKTLVFSFVGMTPKKLKLQVKPVSM